MKRTAEIVLGIIGTVVYALSAAMGGFVIWLQNNPDFLEEITAQARADSPQMEIPDAQTLIDSLGSDGVVLLVASIIAVVAGIVAMILLKGNSRPKTAGIIFIATAVILPFIPGAPGIFVGIFYVIAGILALARKPKQDIATI